METRSKRSAKPATPAVVRKKPKGKKKHYKSNFSLFHEKKMLFINKEPIRLNKRHQINQKKHRLSALLIQLIFH